MGWACWKTYLAAAGDEYARSFAMGVLSTALVIGSHAEAALQLLDTRMEQMQRLWPQSVLALDIVAEQAHCLDSLERYDKALRCHRAVHNITSKMYGLNDARTIASGLNLSNSLTRNHDFAQARHLLRRVLRAAKQTLGELARNSIQVTRVLARALAFDPDASRANLVEAERLFADALERARRVFGPPDEYTQETAALLAQTRERLAALPPDTV